MSIGNGLHLKNEGIFTECNYLKTILFTLPCKINNKYHITHAVFLIVTMHSIVVQCNQPLLQGLMGKLKILCIHIVVFTQPESGFLITK